MTGDAVWRVVAAHSNSGVACAAHGELRRIHFRRSGGRPLAGDRVTLDEAGAINAILPRRNVFGRGIWGNRFREIAANVDRLLIVVAPEPMPSRDLLQRYLAAAHILEIEPLLVLTKADLNSAQLDAMVAPLTALGYTTLRTSTLISSGLDALRAVCGRGISLFVGQSGAGKTSLVNALIPDLDRRTAELSRVTGKGTHTTTTCELHRFEDRAWLADSPGVWEYSLWRMSARELERGFPEFADLSGGCRFNDCRHQDEPGCAVRAAAEAGALPAFRYQAWLRLLAEQHRQGAG